MGSKRKDGEAWCCVCQIKLASEAEFTLHEFSKKHCDNLLRISKNKPIIQTSKQKTKLAPVLKTPATVSAPQQLPNQPGEPAVPGVITKYGYFVLGEPSASDNGYTPREYNYNYDPYLQKLAENPYKEPPKPPVIAASQNLDLPTCNVTSFSRKKRKKARTCQICNVTLNTIPEYDSHMKSAQHIYRLKISGTGVSAHFVKASTDLHTTETASENKDMDTNKTCLPPSSDTPSTSLVFPSLFCDVCDLLMNSDQQYIQHMAGKLHSDNSQKKEIKSKNTLPTSHMLYCYSCQLTLTNLQQFNEHKNGKKHKLKCKRLIREGITIPPEERVPSVVMPIGLIKKAPVYPEMYQQFVKQSDPDIPVPQKTPTPEPTPKFTHSVLANSISGMYHCQICSAKFNTKAKYDTHMTSQDHLTNPSNLFECRTCSVEYKIKSDLNHHIASESHLTKVSIEVAATEGNKRNGAIAKPAIIFHGEKNQVYTTAEEKHVFQCDVCTDSCQCTSIEDQQMKKAAILEKRQMNSVEKFKCQVCAESFEFQERFDAHLGTEEHAKKVLEKKTSKALPIADIQRVLYEDKMAVKKDHRGGYLCGICNVRSSNIEEYKQHITSLVHKHSEKDFLKKRFFEVKQGVEPDEAGLYTCRLCKVSSNCLTDYNNHLHTLIHKYQYKAEVAKKFKAMRRSEMIRRRWRRAHGYAESCRHSGLWRKYERNPGVRTKIGGIATDLSTGQKAAVPNLEPLEPKIDEVKNVHLGVTVVKDGEKKKKFLNLPEAKQRKVESPCRPLMNSSFYRPFPRPRPYHFDNRDAYMHQRPTFRPPQRFYGPRPPPPEFFPFQKPFWGHGNRF